MILKKTFRTNDFVATTRFIMRLREVTANNPDARLTAKKALQFIALIPRQSPDINAVRAETIMHILKIRKALGK